MVTDINNREIDEEMGGALSSVTDLHLKKILRYKRLLEKAHASTAAQLQALQAEVRVLRETVSRVGGSYLGIATSPDRRCVCGGRRRKGYWAGYQDDKDEDDVKGDGKGGGFSEKEVRKARRDGNTYKMVPTPYCHGRVLPRKSLLSFVLSMLVYINPNCI